MTNYEHYQSDLNGLAEKINYIKDFTEKYGFDFQHEVENFLKAEYKSDKIQRNTDRTFVVNIGFVYCMRDMDVPVDIFRSTAENNAQAIVDLGICTLKDQHPEWSEAMEPDDYTLTTTQMFEFGGDA